MLRQERKRARRLEKTAVEIQHGGGHEARWPSQVVFCAAQVPWVFCLCGVQGEWLVSQLNNSRADNTSPGTPDLVEVGQDVPPQDVPCWGNTGPTLAGPTVFAAHNWDFVLG